MKEEFSVDSVILELTEGYCKGEFAKETRRRSKKGSLVPCPHEMLLREGTPCIFGALCTSQEFPAPAYYSSYFREVRCRVMTPFER